MQATNHNLTWLNYYSVGIVEMAASIASNFDSITMVAQLQNSAVMEQMLKSQNYYHTASITTEASAEIDFSQDFVFDFVLAKATWLVDHNLVTIDINSSDMD